MGETRTPSFIWKAFKFSSPVHLLYILVYIAQLSLELHNRHSLLAYLLFQKLLWST